jgi:hypothetical protein
MKIGIAAIVAKAVIASMLAIPPCLENNPPDFHIEVPTLYQPPELTRTVSTSNTTAHIVTYSTPGFVDKNGGNVGRLNTKVFYSVDDAKNASFPASCTFARFEVDGGVYVFHSPTFGWEFLKTTT